MVGPRTLALALALAALLPATAHAAAPRGFFGVTFDRQIALEAPNAMRSAEFSSMKRAGVESVVWASTGGSFVYGWEGAHGQTTALARAAGLPASSASLGFVQAVRALGAARVAVAATYPEEIARLFSEFLGAAGIDVIATHSGGVTSATEAAAWGPDRLKELAVAADRPDADAVLLPDNALHTAAHIRDLEELLAKPVLTANQVTVFEALRLARRRTWAPQLGTLFATREAPPAPVGA